MTSVGRCGQLSVGGGEGEREGFFFDVLRQIFAIFAHNVWIDRWVCDWI